MITIQPKIEKVVLEKNYGKFIAEPLEKGYGVTLGNSLRRVLLSSLQGSAITHVKIAGVLHEFSTLPGVVEDVTEIILNLKSIRFKMKSAEPVTLILDAKGKGEIKAKDIQPHSEIEILTPECHIATLTDKQARLNIEMEVEKGKGYVPAEMQEKDERVGVIPLDSIFSPLQKVNFTVEDTRVGQVTDYNRLILEIWTDGSISPDEALSSAAKILMEYLSLFSDITLPTPREIIIPTEGVIEAKNRILMTPIEELDFSIRSYRCFKKSKINTVGDLVQKTEAKLMSIRNFGKTCLEETKEKLAKLNLSLKEE